MRSTGAATNISPTQRSFSRALVLALVSSIHILLGSIWRAPSARLLAAPEPKPAQPTETVKLGKAANLMANGQFASAEAVLNDLILSLRKQGKEAEIKYCMAYDYRAECLENEKRYQAAAQDMKSFAALLPLCRWSCGKSTRILTEAGLYKDAIAKLNECISVTPTRAGTYAARALCYACNGDATHSAKDLTQALKFHFNAHDRIMHVQPYCSDLTLAVAERSIVAKHTQDSAALFALGIIHWLADKYKLANEDLTKCLKLQPNSWQALIARADCCLSSNDFQGALRDINAAIQLNPTEPVTYACLERYFSQCGDIDQVLPDLDKRLAKQPRNATLWVAKAKAYTDMRDMSKELDAYAHALSIDPRLPEALVGQGRAFQTSSQYKKAIDSFTLALKQQPSNYEVYSDRASCYFAEHDYKNASIDLTRVIELCPNPNAYAARAECYSQLGEPALARKDKQFAAQNRDSRE